MKLEQLAEILKISEDELLEVIFTVGGSYSEDNNNIPKKLEEKVRKHLEDNQSGGSNKEPEQESIPISKVMTVKSFAEAIKVPLVDVMTTLVRNGFMLNLNSLVDFEISSIIAEELGKKVHQLSDELKSEIEELDLGLLIEEKDKAKLVLRAPIVSVIGHVDHGKTSLLDYIRKTNVVSKEAGAITQSIGAYQVAHQGKKITFLDTPGHEAFVAMRRRGVRATDIAILVVAADDGIKAQTVEAINHAKEAGVPIIVAVSKIDKPEANLARIKEQLTEHDLLVEEWGGKVILCPLSSKSGKGIPELLESILLVAEMSELKANPMRSAIGTVIESNLDQKLGASATVVVHTGTLYPRDVVVIGQAYGRVRSLLDHTKKQIDSAGPSVPVLITGLNVVPQVGDILRVVANERLAKNMAENFGLKREKALKDKENLDLDMLNQKVSTKNKGINVILRADTEGSLEAIKNSLAKVKTKDAKIKILRSRTGEINISDITLAQISNSVVVAFNTGITSDSASKAEENKMEILKFDIIYKLVEELTARMLSSLEKEYEEVALGEAEVLKVFLTKKEFMIAGVKLKSGLVKPNSFAYVFRNKEQVGKVKIKKVQLVAEEMSKIEAPAECGITVEGFHIEEKDKLSVFELIEMKAEIIK